MLTLKKWKKITYFADFEQKQIKHKTPFVFKRNRIAKYLLFLFFIFYLFSFFFECLGNQFFSSLTCDLWDTMPHQRSLALSRREMGDFLRGGNHSKHMPPLTCLAWLQPIYYNARFIFMHINITKIFTCGESFDKKINFFFQVQFLKISVFYQVQFLKKNFFSGSVFDNIIFFKVQFLRILFFLRFSFWTNQSATMKT